MATLATWVIFRRTRLDVVSQGNRAIAITYPIQQHGGGQMPDRGEERTYPDKRGGGWTLEWTEHKADLTDAATR